MSKSDHHNVWKLLKMSHLKFWILAFSTNFCPIKTDLSGNTVWPQALGFQKIANLEKVETCGQTVLPDRTVLIGQKLVENGKIQNFKCDILSNFQTTCL